MKLFLTLTLAGTLLAGLMVGTLEEGTDEAVRQGALLGVGVWLTWSALRRFGPARSPRPPDQRVKKILAARLS